MPIGQIIFSLVAILSEGTARSELALLPSFTLPPLLLFNSRLSCLSPSPVALFRESSVFQGLIARASCPPFELRADRI